MALVGLEVEQLKTHKFTHDAGLLLLLLLLLVRIGGSLDSGRGGDCGGASGAGVGVGAAAVDREGRATTRVMRQPSSSFAQEPIGLGTYALVSRAVHHRQTRRGI